MFKTVRLGKFFGIDVFVHWTLWPLFLYFLVISLLSGGPTALVATLSFISVLFVSVYLHELGHALVARKLGIRTKDIILLPIGGVARFEQALLQAKSEVLISAAGPLTNFVISIVAAVPLIIAGTLNSSVLESMPSPSILGQVVQLNLILAVSNLIPALPLDGGRILRGALAMRHGHMPATRTAVRVSRYIGIGLILLAPFTMWIFVLLGLYIILAGLQELWTARFRNVLESTAARQGQSSNQWDDMFEQFGGSHSEANPRRSSSSSSKHDTIDAIDVKHL